MKVESASCVWRLPSRSGRRAAHAVSGRRAHAEGVCPPAPPGAQRRAARAQAGTARAVWPDVFVGDAVLKVTASASCARRSATIRSAALSSRRPTAAATGSSRRHAARPPPLPARGPSGDAPRVSYARSGSVNIAYQVVGSGPGGPGVRDGMGVAPRVLLERAVVRALSRPPVVHGAAHPVRQARHRPVGSGAGRSAPLARERMDDVRAVMEAAGSEHAVLLGISEGGRCAASLRPPTRQDRRADHDRQLRAPPAGARLPLGPHPRERDALLRPSSSRSGAGRSASKSARPRGSTIPAFRDWWASYLRMGASPGAAVALTR
jgi:hypothetical protein